MTMIEKFLYLISEYNRGNYSTSDFCELITLYYRDWEDGSLSPSAEKWLHALDELCGRFSEYPEDLAIPNAFVEEKVIKVYTQSFPAELFQHHI